MAGLLDQFFGNADQTRALGLLGARMMSGDTARGLGEATGFLGEAKDREMQRGLLGMKMEDLRGEIEQRKAKMELAQQAQLRQDRFLNGDPAAGDSVSPSGTFAPSAGGYGYTAPSFAPQGGGGLLAQARAIGIPERAIQADVVFNGGKGISDMLFKRGTPDMQVSNGFAYDKNNLGPGFIPFLNTSQSGQTSMGRIGPDGLPVVSAPRGAMETYQNYRDIDEGTKANFDPLTVTPQGQPPQMTSRGALMRNPQVQGGGQPAPAQGGARIPPAQQTQLDQGRVDILNQELTKAQAQLKAALQSGDIAAANRAATDVSSLNRELGRAGGQSRATLGLPLQSKAEETRDIDDAKAAAARDATIQKGAANSRDTLSYIKEARALFKKGPTNSGIGSAIDATADFFGRSTPGADAAAQLETLSGWMVSNVPRMEGPQSNFDVQNYKTMAGMVGDRTKPLSQRMAALDTLEKLQEKYAHLNGSTDQPAGKTVTRTGTLNGKKVIQYSDGTTEYAN